MSEHEPTPENSVEAEINELLAELKVFDYEGWYHELSAEMQERWYDADMEAQVGKNREQARDNFAQFLEALKKFIQEKQGSGE
jgi:hypothetical protein